MTAMANDMLLVFGVHGILPPRQTTNVCCIWLINKICLPYFVVCKQHILLSGADTMDSLCRLILTYLGIIKTGKCKRHTLWHKRVYCRTTAQGMKHDNSKHNTCYHENNSCNIAKYNEVIMTITK